MDFTGVERRRQFCQRCNGLMFEYYRSPDVHFGLVGNLVRDEAASGALVLCPTCRAKYQLLDRLNPMGQPVERA